MSYNNSRKRWNLMNEIGNSARTRTHIYSLKNVFDDYVTEPKKIANLLNYSLRAAQFTRQNRYQVFQRAVNFSHNLYNNQLPYRANSNAYKFNGSNSNYGL